MKIGRRKIVVYLDDDIDMLDKASEIKELKGISKLAFRYSE